MIASFGTKIFSRTHEESFYRFGTSERPHAKFSPF
jgi:hypothetical protein